MSKGQFVCYVLVHIPSKATYVGKTNHLQRRLRQHNGEISGGARSTRRKKGVWKPLLYVHGFRTNRQVLQFEWAMKHHKVSASRTRGRILQLEKLLTSTRWDKVYLDVQCFLKEETYLKLAGITWEELIRRQIERGVWINFAP